MKHQRSLYAKQNLCESSAASDPTRSCCTPRSSLCLSALQPMQSICICLGGRSWPLTVLCRMMLEQNPLQGLPAWPVSRPGCSAVDQPGCSTGMAALCALGCPAWSRVHSTACFYPSLPYKVSIRQRCHGKGLSWESSGGTRHEWHIYSQSQITVNAGYWKGHHDHHELGRAATPRDRYSLCDRVGNFFPLA